MLNNSTLAGLLLEMYVWEELRRLTVSAPQGNMGLKDLYTKQWRQVQALSETFCRHWRQEYLATLQSCKKGHRTDRTCNQQILLPGMSGPWEPSCKPFPALIEEFGRLMSRSSDRVPLSCIEDLFQRWYCSSVKRHDIMKYQAGSVLPPQFVFAIDSY